MASFEDLKQSHYIRDVQFDFAIGLRKNLRCKEAGSPLTLDRIKKLKSTNLNKRY
jgi:hypothetical protein